MKSTSTASYAGMDKKKQPLLEAIPFEVLETGESVHGSQRLMTVKGIMHRADGQPNGNGRIYPASVLEREVKKLRERIASGESVFSQADHPADGISRISDTAALLKEVDYNPQTKEVIGTAVILPTNKGKDLAAIVRAGGKVGISARGFGTTRLGENGGFKGEIVQPDYSLVTYDFVIGQSTKGAVISSFQEQAKALSGEQEATCGGCHRVIVDADGKYCTHCGHRLNTEDEDALQADVPEESGVTESDTSRELRALMTKYGLALIPRSLHEEMDTASGSVMEQEEWQQIARMRSLAGLPPLGA